MDFESVRLKTREHNQEQLFRFSGDLSQEEKCLLTADINDINFEEVSDFWRQEQRNTAAEEKREPIKMQPVPPEACGSVLRDKDKVKMWERIGKILFVCLFVCCLFVYTGMERISQGKVCAVLLAGGQGTRLGVTYPKGMYNIDLLSGKSLYQIQAERLLRLQVIAGERFLCKVVIPW